MIEKNKITEITQTVVDDFQSQLKQVKEKQIMLEGAIQAIQLLYGKLISDTETDKPEVESEDSKS